MKKERLFHEDKSKDKTCSRQILSADGDNDKAWRNRVIACVKDKNSIHYADDGIFFVHNESHGKHDVLSVVLKSDDIDPDFVRRMMSVMGKAITGKICRLSLWDGDGYGGDEFTDEQLRIIAGFMFEELPNIYIKGLMPDELFPEDSHMRKRWALAIKKVMDSRKDELAELVGEAMMENHCCDDDDCDCDDEYDDDDDEDEADVTITKGRYNAKTGKFILDEDGDELTFEELFKILTKKSKK